MSSQENDASSPSQAATIPEISVIVGTSDAARSVLNCLRSIQASCTGLDTELIVADGSHDATASLVESRFPEVTLIRMAPGTLTPHLWAAGLAKARGRQVAFTTGHSTVPSNWSRALSSAIAPGVAGAGGPLALAADSSLTDAATYFLRYSAFLPSGRVAPHEETEIAGDNAMYRGDDLRQHFATFADGFWEIQFHQLLRGEGKKLVMVPAATIEFGRAFTLRAISAQRFAHGRHFGRWRLNTGREGKARIIAATPIVPLVLLARIARRVVNNGQPQAGSVASGRGQQTLARFVTASPLILWLGACWALGEARGAWEA